MNTVVNIITAICLSLLTLEVIYVIVKISVKKRAERIAFIRSFKKGKCIAIFFIAIPLFFLGYWDSGVNVFESILAAVSHVIGLVVLKFGLEDIPGLLSTNLFYKITVYYCCVLVTINAVLFTLSLIGQRLWRVWQALKIKHTSKDKLYILGYNDDNLSIYKSEKSRNCVIVDNISDKDCATMYINKVSFISCQNFDTVISDIFKCASKKDNKITVVINTEDDEINLKLGQIFCSKINQSEESERYRLFGKLDVHIFGQPQYEAIYEEIVTRSAGCVHYKNKYRMIAMNFIDKYPLTKFMDEQRVDYATSLLKPNVNVNVCMIGFGKPNQQIFLTSVANNQFIASTKTGVGLKPVNYHIFDKAYAENNKGLNHSYYRFKNECSDINPDEYLPLPEMPANEEYYHIDINEPAFYNTIRDIVTAKKEDASFIIISFENDLENIDMAQKLVAKRQEWDVDNLTIFVRARTAHDAKSLFADNNVFFIGNEIESVYNINEITNDKIFQMAQMRNEIYDLEYKITSDKSFVLDKSSMLENRAQSQRGWFITKSQLERESSLYGCLSLRSKLNLMGLDYCKIEENSLPALTEMEYLNIYAGADLPDTQSYGLEVDGKKVVKYTLSFADSRRKNLAIHEHLRWNSFMISHGMIPASKEQILNEQQEREGKLKFTNGKNYSLRRHGNLTTFDGLVEFRQIVANREGDNEVDWDVIKYDYQLLDDAYWLLTKNGYKIVKRCPNSLSEY